jgi:hypothetical protein
MSSAQLQATYGPSNSYFGEFDVIQFKTGTQYFARAIVYIKGYESTINRSSWTALHLGTSEVGVLNALEDLWSSIQSTTPTVFSGIVAHGIS